MGIDTDKIEKRVKAREWADEIVEMVFEETDGMDDEPRVEAVKHIVMRLTRTLPDDKPQEPECVQDPRMTREEAHAFEEGKRTLARMPFGKHEGKSIGNVPIDYLLWLDGQPNFRRDVNRYLRSEVGQERQEDL